MKTANKIFFQYKKIVFIDALLSFINKQPLLSSILLSFFTLIPLLIINEIAFILKQPTITIVPFFLFFNLQLAAFYVLIKTNIISFLKLFKRKQEASFLNNIDHEEIVKKLYNDNQSHFFIKNFPFNKKEYINSLRDDFILKEEYNFNITFTNKIKKMITHANNLSILKKHTTFYEKSILCFKSLIVFLISWIGVSYLFYNHSPNNHFSTISSSYYFFIYFTYFITNIIIYRNYPEVNNKYSFEERANFIDYFLYEILNTDKDIIYVYKNCINNDYTDYYIYKTIYHLLKTYNNFNKKNHPYIIKKDSIKIKKSKNIEFKKMKDILS